MDLAVTTTHPPALGLPAILQSAAAELTELAVLADDLGVCSAADAERWRSLDRMSQHLGELATFLRAVSQAIPESEPDLADAIAAIRVGRLVNRFTSRPAAEPAEQAGDFEMFGA